MTEDLVNRLTSDLEYVAHWSIMNDLRIIIDAQGAAARHMRSNAAVLARSGSIVPGIPRSRGALRREVLGIARKARGGRREGCPCSLLVGRHAQRRAGGAEALCRMFPGADIYTHVPRSGGDFAAAGLAHNRDDLRRLVLPRAGRVVQSYLRADADGARGARPDRLRSDHLGEAWPASCIVPGLNAVHLSYVHSPMRSHLVTSTTSTGRVPPARPADDAAAVPLAARDVPRRASSTVRGGQLRIFVARRIDKYLSAAGGRRLPPVAVDLFAPVPPDEAWRASLWAGELVSYKRPEVAIDGPSAQRPPPGRDRARRGPNAGRSNGRRRARASSFSARQISPRSRRTWPAAAPWSFRARRTGDRPGRGPGLRPGRSSRSVRAACSIW